MNTPIVDFIKRYAESGAARLHMPGHKGKALLGPESGDITEISGADSLFRASGIIRESEENASALFGCPTYYSTEGSSLSIRAMLYLVQLREKGRMKIAAARNVHKVFIDAAAMLDFDIDWLCPEGGSYLSCPITAELVEKYLCETDELPRAVYLTSPDYLGNIIDVGTVAEVCHKRGVMLLVDSAHGAYLHFLPQPCHPIDLGADLCASSAHKTLPALTGGAYLHVSERLCLPPSQVRDALTAFASTSPSYLIMESLDALSAYLEDYPERLAAFIPKARAFAAALSEHGYDLAGDEPLKITVMPKSYGYTGTELALLLEEYVVFSEFSDPDHLVMMLTPETEDEWLLRTLKALKKLPRRDAITDRPPAPVLRERRMSIREAALSPRERVGVREALGRTLAAASVSCPPAVPIAVCGEIIDESAVDAFRYYGVDRCAVVKDARDEKE